MVLLWGPTGGVFLMSEVPLQIKGGPIQRLVLSAEQPAPAPHLECACAALRIVLVTVPRVGRSGEHFPNGFDLRLLRAHSINLEPALENPKNYATPS